MEKHLTCNTEIIDSYPISEMEFRGRLMNELISSHGDEIKNSIDCLEKDVSERIANKNGRVANKNVWIDFQNRIIWPDFTRSDIVKIDSMEGFNQESYANEHKLINDCLSNTLPTLTEVRKNRALLKRYFSENGVCVCVNDESLQYTHPQDISSLALYDYNNNSLYTDYSVLRLYKTKSSDVKKDIFAFTVARLDNIAMKNAQQVLFNVLIEFGLCLDKLLDESKRMLMNLTVMVKSGYFSYAGNCLEFRKEDFMWDIISDPNGELTNRLRFDFINVMKEIYQQKKIQGGDMEEIKERLLFCEKKRADIEPYEEKLLTDPNRGHWDLWKSQYSDDEYTVLLEETLYARNPKCDINEEGVIAIDFGTKSTIVVYQSDIEHSLPMGIGDGNLSEGPTPLRYENPTVMHFVDLDSFLRAYREKEGRPDTCWTDLTISHTAQGQFETSKSDEYYEYIHQIKQWAGQREKQFRIKVHSGDSVLLKPFLELGEEDLNPIELYAYYIGLYINNMRKGHGIFLDYYLSFPVTYEVRIREKILQSFEKGLRKSLPEAVLRDPEIMARFHVNGEISEPAAYAVCALLEYGFEPVGDEEIFYGIFDFGGGTTDFDFGLWKESKKRRYDYTIENFGAGGDEFLGGENLLEMLAFEIFKKNQTMMREKRYTFTLAPKCTEFMGSDALLSDSQEAEKNMFNLMNALRPFWEESAVFLVTDEQLEDMSVDDYTKYILKAMEMQNMSESLLHDLSNQFVQIREEYSMDGYELHAEEIKKQMNSLLEKKYGWVDGRYSHDDEVTLKIDLFDKDGLDHANEPIVVSKKEIASFIEEKIRDGVKNFFAALLLSYQNDKIKKPTTVNILLAGNSCKSPMVKKIFKEEIEVQQKNIKEKFNIEGEEDKLFEIFPPLGTPDAYRKMKERGIPYRENDYEKPTGKTGVAFGLIQCREGGTIERVTNIDSNSEIPFQFFIGWQVRKKFKIFKDDNKATKYLGKPDYNEWYQFIEADSATFYLYYTTLPECVNGDLLIDGNAAVKRLKCTVDVVDENAGIYIKAVSPHTIQYVVANGDDVDSCKLGAVFTKELG